jgi:hypothetical protein
MQLQQIQIDFTHRLENNISSQKNLNSGRTHFSNQCLVLFQALMRGEIINGDTAKDLYQIRDMIRRYHDLEEGGVLISQRTIPNSHGMIEIYMTQEQKQINLKSFKSKML